MSEVTKAINYLNEFSDKEGIYLFQGTPSVIDYTNVCAPDTMDIDSFLKLSKLLDCKIIYHEMVSFSTVDFEYLAEDEEECENEYEDMDDAKKVFIENELQTLTKKWGEKIDSPKWVEILFYHNGISHLLEVIEPWFKEFQADFKSIDESVLSYDENKSAKEREKLAEVREELERNKEQWCNIVAEDREFQRAKSYGARKEIALRVLPELNNSRNHRGIIGMIITDSIPIAENNLINEICDLNAKVGSTTLSIAANLDISEHKVRKVLAKVRKY